MEQWETVFSGLTPAAVKVSPDGKLFRQKSHSMPEYKTVYISKQFDLNRLKRFVVVDTETTGIDCDSERIVQLSAMRFENGKAKEYWDTYVNPGKRIRPEAARVNGITQEMVKDAPRLEEVTESFLEFLKDDPLVGYNIKFDLSFLWCSGIDLITDQEIYDAMLSAYGVFPKRDPRLKDRKLTTVADYYRIDFPAHNSLGDVYATGVVLVKVAEGITGSGLREEPKDLRPLHEKRGIDAVREELKEFEQKSYAEMVDYLLKKYGPAEADYFTDSVSWIKNRNISRTREGLYCHHIDEDVIPTLSDPEIARAHPFRHQKKDRLLYCNLLEHLLLHVRIGRDRFWKNHESLDDPSLFAEFITHGVAQISKDLNDMYQNECGGSGWRDRCYAEIEPFYEDYVQLQKNFQTYLLEHYEQPEYPITPEAGNAVIDENDNLWTVVKCTSKSAYLRYGKDQIRVPLTKFLKSDLSVEEAIEEVRRILSETGEGRNEAVYEDIEVQSGSVSEEC